MANDIKGVFQIFLNITDNKKYEYNKNTELIEIFQNDSSVTNECNKYIKILKDIDNFNLLLEEVDLFYIKKTSTQDFFLVGKNKTRQDYEVLIIWSSNKYIEEVIIEEVNSFNNLIKTILKKSNYPKSKKMFLEIKGGEEIIAHPASNSGNKEYKKQKILDFYSAIHWLTISEIDRKVWVLDKITFIVIIITSLFILAGSFLTKNMTFLSIFVGIAIPIAYEILRRKLADSKKIRFSFNSLLNSGSHPNLLDDNDENDNLKDPELIIGDKNE